jgi:hypothetical protein
VEKDTLEHAFANLGALPNTVALHASLGELLLRLFKPPDTRAGRQTWEQDEPSEGNGEANDTIYDKYPAPKRKGLLIAVYNRDQATTSMNEARTIQACPAFH